MPPKNDEQKLYLKSHMALKSRGSLYPCNYYESLYGI